MSFSGFFQYLKKVFVFCDLIMMHLDTVFLEMILFGVCWDSYVCKFLEFAAITPPFLNTNLFCFGDSSAWLLDVMLEILPRLCSLL